MKAMFFLDDLLGYVRQFKVVRKLFSPFYHLLHKDNSVITKNELKKNFQRNGLRVLEIFDCVMREHGYKYSLAFGTMLGAIRENGFIKHDSDIDVLMWIDDYSPKVLESLLERGFIITHSFSVENDKFGKEVTIALDGVQIDIFYAYPAIPGRSFPYCCDFIVQSDCLSREHAIHKYGGLLPRRIEVPITHKVVMVPFESLSLPVLENAHEFLSARYGNDYMIPNSNWSNDANPNIIPWYGKIAIYKENYRTGGELKF